jgi:tetratricopeptide (TPR) repeat protein
MKTKIVLPNNRQIFFVGIIIILLMTGLIYRSSLKGEFLSYDDTENVVNNPLIRNLTLNTIPQFFHSEKLYMYTPLTFLSYALDYKIGGMDPYWFRFTNLLLNLLNIILTFILALQLLNKRILALFVAILFAVHPINVDSVAWISARSNLLAGTFILLSIIFYLFYIKKFNYWYLTLSVLTYLLSILSKSSFVLLPVFLFFLDYLQRRKWSAKTVIEKAPYFLFGLMIGLVTLFFRTDIGYSQSVASYSSIDRIFMLFYSLDGYLLKAILPVNLSEIYTYPVKINGFLPILYYFSPIIFILIPVFLIISFKSKDLQKQIITYFLFFLLLIIPTQSVIIEDGFMANRYGYIPLIGIFILLVVLINIIVMRFPTIIKWLIPLTIIIFIGFSVHSYNRSKVWRTTTILFDHAISVSPDASFAYNGRGMAKYLNNDFDGALADYNEAIKLNPVYSTCFYNRGIVFYNDQQYKEALQDYSSAIKLNSKFASCYDARGILYMDIIGNDSLALLDYNQAIQINPKFAQAYYNRGILFMRMQNTVSACNDFRKVKQLGYSQANELIERYCQ